MTKLDSLISFGLLIVGAVVLMVRDEEDDVTRCLVGNVALCKSSSGYPQALAVISRGRTWHCSPGVLLFDNSVANAEDGALKTNYAPRLPERNPKDSFAKWPTYSKPFVQNLKRSTPQTWTVMESAQYL